MLNTLIVTFKNKLSPYEIPMFRGAVIGAIGKLDSVLFHNHIGEGFRYKYPMIQYKRIHGQAAIVCVGDGCEVIGSFFGSTNYELRIGENRTELFEIESIVPYRTNVQVWNESYNYYISNWLALNPENYQIYLENDGVVERIQMLEKILIGNVLSLCKGLNITIESDIICKITNIEEPHKVYYKGVPMMSFKGEFKTNVTIPDFIGIGKGVSIGHGIVFRKKK